MLNLTKTEINTLWTEGYRPFEIYTYNKTDVPYYEDIAPAGTVSGWSIEHVFAKRQDLKDYPFFDDIIMGSDMSVVTVFWKGL